MGHSRSCSQLSALFNVYCDQDEGPIPTDHESQNLEWTQDSSRRKVDKALAPGFTMQCSTPPPPQTQFQVAGLFIAQIGCLFYK